MAPIALEEPYDAQPKSLQAPNPRVAEQEELRVTTVPESPPSHESGPGGARSATTAALTHSRADGRRRLLVIGSAAISLVLLFVLATLAFN
jgi:hypothetical protein